MPDAAAIEIARSNLADHPAVQAWSRLGPERVEPTAIETLKRKSKAAIYRLHSIGPAGSAVVAKRCLTQTALTERAVYEEILPSLPQPALSFFGFVEDDAPGFHWLFIEDAGQQLYSPLIAQHRAAAVRWMAGLHTSAARLSLTERLPDRGPRFYLEQLRLALNNIRQGFSNPALKTIDLKALSEIYAQCESVERRWLLVERFCQDAPITLVHGDLNAKNLRIRSSRNAISLLAFDWELAGWGIPATDVLKCPDFALYSAEVRKTWPQLTCEAICSLAELGKLFRTLISIYWKSLALGGDWVEWPVDKLRLYGVRLAEATEALGMN